MANYTVNAADNSKIVIVNIGGHKLLCLQINVPYSISKDDIISINKSGLVFPGVLNGSYSIRRSVNPAIFDAIAATVASREEILVDGVTWVLKQNTDISTGSGDARKASRSFYLGTSIAGSTRMLTYAPFQFGISDSLFVIAPILYSTVDNKYIACNSYNGEFSVNTPICANYETFPAYDCTGLTDYRESVDFKITVYGYFDTDITFVEDYTLPDDDPYAKDPDGESGAGGGTGTFDGTGDAINVPNLPTLSAVDAGFITLFNPTAAQLKNLANYMWSTGFDLNTFKKMFADPMDCILGLSIVPVAIPNAGVKTVNIGNISTSVEMNKAATQYVEVDCGTLNVREYWGAYLDYDPYTQAEIYLPYIGIRPLKVDDIMGKSVKVVYHIDILSGACAAFIKCDDSILYQFIGQCSSSIPITGNDWTNVINGVISIAGAIGSMVATGGATAPMAAGMIASTAVNSMKPNVEKSGAMSGTGGMLATQTPYLILTRPRQAKPKYQNKFTGYPSFITEKLDSISGYTEIESVHLENIPATEQELSEIENLLKSGVIF